MSTQKMDLSWRMLLRHRIWLKSKDAQAAAHARRLSIHPATSTAWLERFIAPSPDQAHGMVVWSEKDDGRSTDMTLAFAVFPTRHEQIMLCLAEDIGEGNTACTAPSAVWNTEDACLVGSRGFVIFSLTEWMSPQQRQDAIDRACRDCIALNLAALELAVLEHERELIKARDALNTIKLARRTLRIKSKRPRV